MLTRCVAFALAAGGVVAIGTSQTFSQDYPSKPMRILASAPGGGSDFTSRIIAQGLIERFGQPVIVDNRPGVIPGEVGAKAPPDGYTLLVDGSSFWLGSFTQRIPYDAVRDFAPVTIVYTTPQILIVHPSLPVKSVGELIAFAKSKPGALNYSFSGVGGNSHLSMELFKSMAAINVVAVPYKGTGQSVSALLGGEVQMMVASQASIAPYIKSTKLRALAVTSVRPSPLVPDLPTIAATGLPGYEAIGMQGVFVPAKTPAERIKRLSQEIARIITRPDVKEKFFNIGVEVVGSSPEQFAAVIKSDIAKWGKVIKEAGIRAE